MQDKFGFKSIGLDLLQLTVVGKNVKCHKMC